MTSPMTRSRLFSTASAAAMAAAAMALLTGCASGPAHPPPSPALSEAAATAFKHQAGWQPLSKMAPGAISSATEPWWRVFNDAELDRLMQTASAGNLDIAQATARDRQARALWRQAGAIRSPQLGVSASALRTESSSASGDTTYTAGLQASWALDLWGRLARAAVFNAQGFACHALSKTQKQRLRAGAVNYVVAGDIVGALLCHPETRFYVRQNPGTNAHSPDAFAFDAEGFPIPARRTWLSRAVEVLSRLLLALETLGFTNVTRRLLACPAPA